MKTKRWAVIGQGKNGWHAKGENVSSSGGTLEEYLKEAFEGALVYDASGADTAKFVSFVVNGPMVDPKLGISEVNKFNLHDNMRNMLPALGGGFKTIAQNTLNGYCSLDTVGVGVFKELMKEIPGMKLGHAHSGKVIWDAP